ncbi:Imm21 family immunity protein [Myxococcaceae bacterium GXIMD 01537]
MQWIASSGGPLVLLPKSLVSKWRGVHGGPGGEPSDYDVACGVDGYVGVMTRHGRQVLVLNDEPLQTAIVRANWHGFVRWVYAPSKSIAETSLATMSSEGWGASLETVVLRVDEPSHLLMDAGALGMPRDGVGDLRMELDVGTYDVRVHEFAPSDDVKFLVVALQARR